MALCAICPRDCGIDRRISAGFCGEKDKIRVSKVMLHKWEEPCISAGEGSGAVFFSGCPLHCVYCQNRKISGGGTGKLFEPEELTDIFLNLQSRGAVNINLVTPTHFTPQIIEALKNAGERLKIPVVWNTSGYEKKETVEALSDYVDIFLTDYKYASPVLSEKYSNAPDYPETALCAVKKMVEITGKPVFDGDILLSGTIIRHLVLPGYYRESICALRRIAEEVGTEKPLLSLMSQYTPDFLPSGYSEINRRVTTFEYEKVLNEARRLGFEGYMQARSSASEMFTPDFDIDNFQ